MGTLEVPLATLDKLKQRVNLAKEVERAIHRVQKKNHDEGWMREAAETLGVDIDDVRSEFLSNPVADSTEWLDCI